MLFVLRLHSPFCRGLKAFFLPFRLGLVSRSNLPVSRDSKKDQ
jgi:hypothetical protein